MRMWPGGATDGKEGTSPIDIASGKLELCMDYVGFGLLFEIVGFLGK
jgi:hypothetical protein